MKNYKNIETGVIYTVTTPTLINLFSKDPNYVELNGKEKDIKPKTKGNKKKDKKEDSIEKDTNLEQNIEE